jgi:hypothetical protein
MTATADGTEEASGHRLFLLSAAALRLLLLLEFDVPRVECLVI